MSYQESEEFKNRSKKLAAIKAAGINPYPHKFNKTTTIEEIISSYGSDPIGNSEQASSGNTKEACIAGRLILFRAMGKNAFAQLQESSHKIQLMFNREATQVVDLKDHAESHLKFIEKHIDLGDIIGVDGNLFRTKTGELTLFVKQFTLLCKTLLPLPEKHSGLTDKESRYRKRWLDLITHEEIRHVFLMRSRMMQIIRSFLNDQKFLEVETPILQNVYGGAEARPFCTHINAIDQDVFMRISLEIPLKKILAGGMERIYEIGKVFRNEGIDRTHNPEFTMLEAYAAYWDYNDMIHFVDTLIERIAMELLGTTKITYLIEDQEVTINLKAPWKRLTMKESILEYAGIDVDKLTDIEIYQVLKERTKIDGAIISKSSRGALIAMLFEEFVVKKLIHPHHIVDHPIETTPLCKPHRKQTQAHEGLVERFESFVLGRELCNAYSELNDPELQRSLLEKQSQQEDAHPLDEEFVEAVCQGMPPAGGIGIGLDRLAMLLTKADSIRDVIYFPMLKPTQI